MRPIVSLKSILFSLYQHFRTLRFCDALADTWSALCGIVRATNIRTFDQKVVGSLRTSHCEGCLFYDTKWKTCGTPGETMGEPLGVRIKVGCWCYLPLANRDPKKDCWARMNNITRPDGTKVGWPDVVRPPSKP